MDKKFIVLNEMAIENGRSLANEINGFVAIRTNGKPQFNLNDPNTCNQELDSIYGFYYYDIDKNHTFPFVFHENKSNINKSFHHYDFYDMARYLLISYLKCNLSVSEDEDWIKHKIEADPTYVITARDRKEVRWNGLCYLDKGVILKIVYCINYYFVTEKDEKDQDILIKMPVIRLISGQEMKHDDLKREYGAQKTERIIKRSGGYNNMGKIKGSIHMGEDKDPIMLFCENTETDIEDFDKIYPPRIRDIIIQENITSIDDLNFSIQHHRDPNMLSLYNKEICLRRRENNRVDQNNIKAYNRINVVAFNASIDLMRQHWKDIPDMARQYELGMEIWPEYYELCNMIEYGDPQEEIEAFFPKCFKEWTILPSQVKGDKEKMIKFYTSVQTHRRFKVLDKDGNDVTYDDVGMNYRPTLEEVMSYRMVEDTSYTWK